LRGRITILAVSGSNLASDRSSPESLGDVRAFARYFHVAYPLAFDPTLSVAKEYLQGGFPTVAFINRQKHVTGIESGEVSLGRLMAGAKSAGASL
jgi:hypothetical protein